MATSSFFLLSPGTTRRWEGRNYSPSRYSSFRSKLALTRTAPGESGGPNAAGEGLRLPTEPPRTPSGGSRRGLVPTERPWGQGAPVGSWPAAGGGWPQPGARRWQHSLVSGAALPSPAPDPHGRRMWFPTAGAWFTRRVPRARPHMTEGQGFHTRSHPQNQSGTRQACPQRDTEGLGCQSALADHC